MAQERRDYDAAEGWYRKSLEIKERLGNEHGAAITYYQLGSVADDRQDYEKAGAWYLKALAIYLVSNDEHYTRITVTNFIITYRAAPEAVKPQLRAQWEAFGNLPNLDELVAQLTAERKLPQPIASPFRRLAAACASLLRRLTGR